MAKLYELAEAFRKLEIMIDEALDNIEESGIDESDIDMFIDTIDSLTESIEVKTENICKFVKNLEGDIAAFKKEEQRLAKRRKCIENKVDGLKTYLSDMLTLAKIDKVNAGSFVVKFQKSPPSVDVINEEIVPIEFREKVADKILKKEILAALKLKQVIPGVVLIEDKKHMRIT